MCDGATISRIASTAIYIRCLTVALQRWVRRLLYQHRFSRSFLAKDGSPSIVTHLAWLFAPVTVLSLTIVRFTPAFTTTPTAVLECDSRTSSPQGVLVI